MAVKGIRTMTGSAAGAAVLAFTPIGWTTGIIAGSLAIMGGIGDMIFGGGTATKKITLNVKFSEDLGGWVPPKEPWTAHMDNGGANGLSQGKFYYNFNHLEYYQELWSKYLKDPEVMKALGILPTDWKKIKSDGLSNNADTIQYDELLETIVANNTMEAIEALSTEELAAMVELEMIRLYPNAITMETMDSFLKNFNIAKDVVTEYSSGWKTAGIHLTNLPGILKATRSSILASESAWESATGDSDEKDKYNQIVDKINKYGAEGGVIPLVDAGLILTRKMNDNLNNFYKFILRERSTRGSMALRAFDSSRVSAISEKYVKLIEGINAKHLKDMEAQQSLWQKKFDAQAALHKKDMADMKAEYDLVISGLKATIVKYEKALTKSLGMLDKFQDRLDAADNQELDSLRSGQTNLRNTSKSAFSKANELRDRPYSPGAATAELASQAALTAETARLAAEEAKKRENLPFYQKYPKELLGGAAIVGLAAYAFNNKGDKGSNTNGSGNVVSS